MLIVGIILAFLAFVFLGFLFKKKIEKNSYITEIINKHPLKVMALCCQDVKSLDNNSRAKILEFNSSDWNVWDNLIKSLKKYKSQSNYAEIIIAYIELYFPDVKYSPHYRSNFNKLHTAQNKFQIIIESLNFEQINSISSIPEQEWTKKLNYRKRANEIRFTFPDAIKEISYIESDLSDEAIIKREKRIEEIQKRYNRAAAYEQWLEKQKAFNSKVRGLRDADAKNCGCYNYEISYMKPLKSGKLVSSSFNVWQIFPNCTSPFYKDFHNSLDFSLVTTLLEFKARTRYYLDSVYEDAIKYIKAVAEDNKLIVLLNNRNSFDWSQESFNFHYFSLISLLNDENIDWINVEEITDNIDGFQYNSALIFDFLTNNDCLKYISKMIIESFTDKVPNIVWYSMIKEYDEQEMYGLLKDKIEKRTKDEK